MNVNEKVSTSLCCGCSACADVCPVKAIKMGYDKDWHLYPEVDNSCINCGKCLSVCPQYQEKPKNEEPIGYAVAAPDDVRMESSSGGVFYILAKYIIDNGGYVAGAVFDEQWQVKHILSNSLSDIARMQHSKYVQSQTAGIYSEVLAKLKEGVTVLFTGTPCQVAALRNFVGDKEYPLFVADILCHGVPSPKVFEYYLNENFDKSQIKDIIFRNKRHRNAAPSSITFVLKSGKTVYSEYFDNSYADAFLSNIAERSSCLNCKFAVFPRVGDISMGDFWGAKTVETKIDTTRGISCVFLNNEKGKSLWQVVSSNFETIENYDNATLMSWNRNKVELSHNKRHLELVPAINKYNSLRTSISHIKDDKYDIGLFGIIPNSNYGGLITYYALYEYVHSLGYSVLMIHEPAYNSEVYTITHATNFFNEYCNLSEVYKPADLYKLNDRVDTFLLGSDQVWNYSLFHCWYENLYFDFVSPAKKKIAYAASFGHDRHTVDQDRKGLVSAFLKEFDYIGVRERDGVTLTNQLYNKNSDVVCDPVFLLNLEKYKQLADKARVKNTGRYVGTYIIEPADFKLDVVNKVVDYLKCGNVNFTDGNMSVFAKKSKAFHDRHMPIVSDASIENWLNMIINAEFVITDSFHCSCFCIMFNKPFIVIQQRWALSRLQTLIDTYGIQNRWLRISSVDEFVINKEWFKPLPDDTEKIFSQQREFGRTWLKNALLSSKTVSLNNAFTPLNDKVRIEDYFFFMMQNRANYILVLSSSKPSNGLINKIDFKCKLSYLNIKIDESKPFMMLYDYSEDKLVTENSDIIDYTYQTANKKIMCVVNAAHKRINKIYINEDDRYDLTEASSDAGAVISIYSKTLGKIVDSFSVVLSGAVPVIKRN